MDLIKLHAYKKTIETAFLLKDSKLIETTVENLFHYLKIPTTLEFNNVIYPLNFFDFSEHDELFIQDHQCEILWSYSNHHDLIGSKCFKSCNCLGGSTIQKKPCKLCPISTAIKKKQPIIKKNQRVKLLSFFHSNTMLFE